MTTGGDARFEVGDEVHKPRGFKFPGWVVARFTTRKGAIRYVVERREPDGEPSEHLAIFDARQLARGFKRDGAGA